MKYHFISSNTVEANKAKKEYINSYSQTEPELADVIVPIGGDGILLKTLHDFNKLDKPFFGINYGSVGFLMNSKSKKNLDELINNSKSTNSFCPRHMYNLPVLDILTLLHDAQKLFDKGVINPTFILSLLLV